ncbi:hypothetical protein F4827_006418 [Paraburkholderia bannensis]|uniref:DUF2957 domain-containing protein n=1 Tax=Paraburkholderia bannensis TaxID=765414 RepID=A0A7W9WWI9_9BURK|nr:MULTISPECIES: DUF2957 domain-containing protein [Paraburkholderia]MBB3261486.1 hypothetical protein [Paraburkholderia sp. WP4_3_2]MBB6106542.1 hypothetical protein [Paraburkholderia bannensis]
MFESIVRCVALAAAATPLLVACGGGKASDPSAINPAQCSGSTCTGQGAPSSATAATALCPADADIAKNTYLGGAGSGEVVSLSIDPTKMTYSLTFLASPIPAQSSSVQNTRAGLTITGAVQHPPSGALPTAAQIACAFQLQQGTGTLNGSTYTTAYNANNPPTIYVGFGVAGGGIPGATVNIGGDSTAALLFPSVKSRTFDFYPFLAFSSVSTSLSDLQGNWNALLYHIVPTQNFAAAATTAQETYDASGNCSVTSGATNTSCDTATSQWATDSNGSYFTSANAPRIQSASVALLAHGGASHLILGKLNGKIVPVVVRTGYVNESLTSLAVDDESGIAMMAPASTLTSGSFDGSFVGADSNFAYTATLINGATGGFLKPSTMKTQSTFTLDYTQTHPGLIGATDNNGKTGNVIAVGGLYGIFLNGEENGGVTSTSANSETSNSPYFGVGALIQPQ